MLHPCFKRGPCLPTRLLTVREVAERLAVYPSTVHNLCVRGRPRFVMVGVAVRIDLASLEAFLASGGDSPTGE